MNGKKKVVIALGKGMQLITDEEIDPTELMTSIGVLVSMLAEVDKSNGASKERFKTMMNTFIDVVYNENKSKNEKGKKK